MSMRHAKHAIYCLAALYLIGTLLGGIGLGWIALHPPRHSATPAEVRNVKATIERGGATFQDVELVAADGAILRAWLMRPSESNGNAVILLHGVADSRLGMYGYGKWLLENHYSVLLPDARAHGSSGGEFATYGLLESEDIHRWVDWLVNTDHPLCVFGLGESMGAAQLLQALPREPLFCSVVAESPFATFREVAYARFGRQFHTGPWLGRTFFRPTVEIGFLFVRICYGFDMERASPAQAVSKTETPVLLIHGLSDRNIPPYHSQEIQSRNPSHVAVWMVAKAIHTGAHRAEPKEFESRVLLWFSDHMTHR
jgi:dipeptidyl aminopeptidase/acylaminoacyl peptidase